jgi:type IV secretion system protein TrbE
MLNLAEYRRKGAVLADYLPWACLVAPGLVLNKDGSLQRTIAYRGPDLDSATPAELVAITARLNLILKRFGEGWAVFFEADRIPAQNYPGERFADAASWLVDRERCAAFSSRDNYYESRYYLTLLYLPPPEHERRAEKLLIEREGDATPAPDGMAQLEWFATESRRIIDLLATLFPEVYPLGDAETLTYLHGTISDKRHFVAAPSVPAHLDALLSDTPFLGGLEPKLGEKHLRVLTVTGFPNITAPGLLDALNDLGFAYRWSTRWIALDKIAAGKQLRTLRRQWFAKRKSMLAVLREVMFNRETALVDADAENKAADADAALQELGADDVAFGYLTMTVVIADDDEVRVGEHLLAVERVLNGHGLVTIRETLNAVEAWLGSLPGNPYANIRQPIVHTLNLAHLMPVSAVWAGPRRNDHLNAPPLMLTETRGTTPFRFDLHVGDVGHAFIVGPTGSGKSVFLSFLALQFRRFIDAQLIIFDRGRSARAAALAMDGDSIEIGLEGALALQPLARIDEPGEISFALEWVMGLLTNEGVEITPEVKDLVWSALQNLATAPRAERTLTGLAVLIQSSALAQALIPYTLDGPYGQLLDGASETLNLASVLHFEMEPLMAHKPLIPPVLTYLFHRLEARFDGRPTLLILDEAWTFLDNEMFAARLREWLKTLRKRNVSVVFATQSLADIERSTIAPALIESCPTRIFLPNDRAIEPQSLAIYERFGLNARQVEILSQATPKRDYYVQTARGNRLFALGLQPIALALTAAGSPKDQELIDALLASNSDESFAAGFLRAKDLPWAADLLETFPGKQVFAAKPNTPATEPAAPHAPVAVDDGEDTVDAAPDQEQRSEPVVAAHRENGAPQPVAAIVRRTSKGSRRTLMRGAGAAALIAGLSYMGDLPPARAITVFDPINFQQNLLSAVRALEQINNQVSQLQNQAQTLLRLDQNLQKLGATLSPDLQRALTGIETRLAAGEGLALKLKETEAAYAKLFPQEPSADLSGDETLQNALARWNEAYLGLKRAAFLQGQIAESLGVDRQLLDQALARSGNASGALDVNQAGNELTALGVKQSLQLQSLLVAQERAETLERARGLATENEARVRFKRFLGEGRKSAGGR